MSSTVKQPDILANQMALDPMGRPLQQPSSIPMPYNQPGVIPQKNMRDMSKEELWKIAHSADLSGLRPQNIPLPLPPQNIPLPLPLSPQNIPLSPPNIPLPLPNKGLPIDPNGMAFEELDLTLLGLPSIRGGRRRERDIPVQDPAAIFAGLHNIPDIVSQHHSYSRNELEEWPLVDIIIHVDLIFIIVDAPGFDLQSYYFEEAEPDVLVMIGQKTHQAALVELTNAPDNIWVFRQRPRGNTFVRKIDLRRFNFKLDPTTLTYGNYNGCIVYRGLREQPVRPKQLFRYV